MNEVSILWVILHYYVVHCRLELWQTIYYHITECNNMLPEMPISASSLTSVWRRRRSSAKVSRGLKGEKRKGRRHAADGGGGSCRGNRVKMKGRKDDRLFYPFKISRRLALERQAAPNSGQSRINQPWPESPPLTTCYLLTSCTCKHQLPAPSCTFTPPAPPHPPPNPLPVSRRLC